MPEIVLFIYLFIGRGRARRQRQQRQQRQRTTKRSTCKGRWGKGQRRGIQKPVISNCTSKGDCTAAWTIGLKPCKSHLHRQLLLRRWGSSSFHRKRGGRARRNASLQLALSRCEGAVHDSCRRGDKTALNQRALEPGEPVSLSPVH